jgi:hypothetical protein
LHWLCDDPPRKLAPRMSAGVQSYSFWQKAVAQSPQNFAPSLVPPPPQPASKARSPSNESPPRLRTRFALAQDRSLVKQSQLGS